MLISFHLVYLGEQPALRLRLARAVQLWPAEKNRTKKNPPKTESKIATVNLPNYYEMLYALVTWLAACWARAAAPPWPYEDPPYPEPA